MLAVKAQIRRYVDNSFPGWVECAFSDAGDHEHLVVEKVPVLTMENLTGDNAYPLPCAIACSLLNERLADDGRVVLIVDTEVPWGIESITCQTQFEVFREQVVEIRNPPSNLVLRRTPLGRRR